MFKLTIECDFNEAATAGIQAIGDGKFLELALKIAEILKALGVLK